MQLPRNAPVWLDRLSTWLEPFETRFTHVGQRSAFRRYLGGLLILDGTSLPKQGGRGSVAVRARMLGAAWYLPEEWLTPEARQHARISASIRLQEKWRVALTLLRQIRAAGFHVTAVVGDAEFGDNATLRRTLHRLKLPYALGISSSTAELCISIARRPNQA